uniref:2-(3-amino-3-carboxypropyl)histidine synthase subunit 2 n=1 Tax=Panagrolaimus sp. PS1159 TaxID=55785 RepID=A0AC35FE83_9BILA
MSDAVEAEPLPSGAFYTEDHVVEQEADEINVAEQIQLDPASPEFDDFFEINRVVNWIKENGYQRVAFQLPDNLLSFAFTLARRCEKESGSKIYILADTSYRSCCIDAVAAEHANCDSLVHFGEACMSTPTTVIPVLYVFGKLRVDFEDFALQLKKEIKEENVTEMVLLYEPGYDAISSKLEDTIHEILPSSTTFSSCHLAKSDSTMTSLGRELPTTLNEATPATLIFIGNSQSALLPIWLLTHIQFNKVISYFPQTKAIETHEPKSLRSLRKRLFLIEKLRDSNVIGLVVGTLGVEGIKEAIERIRKLCKEANKKLYVLSIGKVNEPKLSNFATDIDAFILLSCPFGIILDSSDFFKPIVSLFEAEIALNPSKDWYASGGWSAQFEDFVQDEIGKLNKNAVDVSLISGRIRATQLDDHRGGGDDGENSNNKQILEYSAGNYFSNRTWKGLDNTYVEEDLSLNEGLKGIAMEYVSEPPK